MILLFSVFLYCHISISIGKETIWINSNLGSDNNVTCTDPSLCIVQCNAEYSCSSMDRTSSKAHIICPQHGANCIINCKEDRSCSNNIIMTGYCKHVEINVYSKYNSEMVINAPINGDLYINLISDEAMFNENIIYAHNTNNIIINCDTKGSCNKNQIYAETLTNTLNVSCTNGINCNEQEIHCPDNNKPHVNPSCNIVCDGDASCSDLNVFAMNGTKRRNGVTFECDEANDVLCDGSTVYCRRDRVCNMKYDMIHNIWHCQGLCGDTTSIPTQSPTITPTHEPTSNIIITQTTKSYHDYTQYTSLNTSAIRSDIDTNTSRTNGHDLEVIIAYILIGGLIGGCAFCVCIICMIMCLIERRLGKCWKKMEDGASQNSSVSFEYYGDNDTMTCHKKHKSRWKFGRIILSEIIHSINTIIGLDKRNNVEDTENNNTESNDVICSHCSLPSIRSTHKQSTSSSSSYDDQVLSSSESSICDECEHRCYVEISSNHPVNQSDGIAISLNNDDNKIGEEGYGEDSDDTYCTDGSSTECEHCSGRNIVEFDDEYYDDDNDDDDTMPREDKRYRIEVSAPIEPLSSVYTETSAKSISDTDLSSTFLSAKV